MHVHVNVANGNLIVHERDLKIAGTARLDLSLERYFNSLSHKTRDLGSGGVFSTGALCMGPYTRSSMASNASS